MSRLEELKKKYYNDVAKIINEYCMISKLDVSLMRLAMLSQLVRISFRALNSYEILEKMESYNWEEHVKQHICKLFTYSCCKVSRKHCRYCNIEKITKKKKKNLVDIVRLSELKRGLYREKDE
jgi:hypothetical protein